MGKYGRIQGGSSWVDPGWVIMGGSRGRRVGVHPSLFSFYRALSWLHTSNKIPASNHQTSVISHSVNNN